MNSTNKKIFSKNLNNLLAKKNIKRPKLAKDLHVSYSNVVNWTTAQAYPRINSIERLANYFHITKADLVENNNKMPSGVFKPKGYVRVPVLSSIPCGDANSAIRETNKYKWIPAEAYHHGCFLLRSYGHSMEPKIKNDALVMIDPNAIIDNKDIAAVSVNQGDATLKQVIKNGNQVVVLHPLNSAFKNIFPSEDVQCSIIGKAISVTNPL